MSATGGTTNDYTESGISYRSHTFLSSGAFNISSLGTGDTGTQVDVLVVGGGGGGGSNIAAGGGAGGFRSFTNVPESLPDHIQSPSVLAAVVDLVIIIQEQQVVLRRSLLLYGPTVGSGGGGGGSYSGNAGKAGGSGGGGAGHGEQGGATQASPDGISPTVQGNDGGAGAPGRSTWRDVCWWRWCRWSRTSHSQRGDKGGDVGWSTKYI